MPGKDGNGPAGNGRRNGMGQLAGIGPEGFCKCPKCGAQVEHKTGTPCTSMKCPKCGSLMIRP